MGGILTRRGERVPVASRENLQAYENYLLGIEHKHRFTQEATKALEILTKAIGSIRVSRARCRPSHGNGVAAMVNIHTRVGVRRVKALRSIALDPSDNQAQGSLFYSYVGDLRSQGLEKQKALSLNPNDADVLIMTAAIMPCSKAGACSHWDRAMRINPQLSQWYKFNPALMLDVLLYGPI